MLNNYDHNKRIILLLILFKCSVLFQSDNINRMITLTMITLSKVYCIMILGFRVLGIKGFGD
jgi:hypothetical protein